MVLAGAIFNVIAAMVVLYVAIRNWKIHGENMEIIEKIEAIMRELDE